MTGTTIDSAQIADDYVYICYGSYAGTGMIFQGGEIARLLINDPENTAVEILSVETETCELYVSSVDRVHSLYYPKYDSKTMKTIPTCLDVASGQETEVTFVVHPKGEFYTSGNTICVHMDLSGSEMVLISPSDYSTVGSVENLNSYPYNAECVEVENVSILGDWVYFFAEKSVYTDSMGWRYSYKREQTVIFRKNLKTGVVQELHSY